MDPANSPPRRPLTCAKGGAVWSWLAVAAAAGFLAVRSKPKIGVLLGLSVATLGCWKNRHGNSAKAIRETEPVGTQEKPPATPPTPKPVQAAASVGTLLLQVEPLPSVVEEEARGMSQNGEAEHVLDQEPLLAFEDPFSLEDSPWLNQGAEIPDTIELPELLDSDTRTP